jgi:ATPase subunit of ABC transporter with duplicated ATPase domains
VARRRFPRPAITDIENAFQPAKEITDAERSGGCVDSVTAGYHALLSAGSNIAIVGNRGIGKTSLARQIITIASGQSELLDKLAASLDALNAACPWAGPTVADAVEFAFRHVVYHVGELNALAYLSSDGECGDHWMQRFAAGGR